MRSKPSLKLQCPLYSAIMMPATRPAAPINMPGSIMPAAFVPDEDAAEAVPVEVDDARLVLPEDRELELTLRVEVVMLLVDVLDVVEFPKPLRPVTPVAELAALAKLPVMEFTSLARELASELACDANGPEAVDATEARDEAIEPASEARDDASEVT